MKYLLFLMSTILLLLACEDKKKASEEIQITTNTPLNDDGLPISDEELKDTLTETKANSEKIGDEVEIKYPKITQENVVTFLTEYGKNNPETKVRISTRLGDIDILLYKDTPLHRANFIYLIKQNYFDDTFFHRVVPKFIIQGGNSDDRSTSKKRTNIGRKYLLPAEIIKGRNHRYGTISGAKQYRENPGKLSAPFEFFIFLGPIKHTGHLNGDYTIFGKVTKGMNVVEKIANEPADEGEWPLDNVYIKAEIIK